MGGCSPRLCKLCHTSIIPRILAHRSIIRNYNLVRIFVNNPGATPCFEFDFTFFRFYLSKRGHVAEKEEGTVDGRIIGQSYEVAAHLTYLIL